MNPGISDVSDVNQRLFAKLDELRAQHESLSRELLDPEILADHRKVRALSIRRASIAPIVSEYESYLSIIAAIQSTNEVIEAHEDDGLVQLAHEELPQLHSRADALLASIRKRLVTADDQSVGSIFIEVRAGVGGDEAGIWAGDLVDMYRRYAASRGWKVEDIELNPGDQGGMKSAIIAIAGEGVWSQLGYEGGTHQVKRVPATEAQGRVHTSTATVAVLPEPEEIEVKLDPNDVKEMITTAQGPGGQNVNKVATCVHLIHVPTGIDVRIQDTKSQVQNREKAWKLLRARLFERQKAEQEARRAQDRNRMIGSGDRAEKIRTYRYKENLAVDHRVGRSFNLGEIISGRMQPLIDALVEHDTAQRLASM